MQLTPHFTVQPVKPPAPLTQSQRAARYRKLRKAELTKIFNHLRQFSVGVVADGRVVTLNPLSGEYEEITRDFLYNLLAEDKRRLGIKLHAELLREHIDAILDIMQFELRNGNLNQSGTAPIHMRRFGNDD